jgi:hypothetical protein
MHAAGGAGMDQAVATSTLPGPSIWPRLWLACASCCAQASRESRSVGRVKARRSPASRAVNTANTCRGGREGSIEMTDSRHNIR